MPKEFCLKAKDLGSSRKVWKIETERVSLKNLSGGSSLSQVVVLIFGGNRERAVAELDLWRYPERRRPWIGLIVVDCKDCVL